MSWTTLAPEVSNFVEITPTVVRRMVVSSNPRYKINFREAFDNALDNATSLDDVQETVNEARNMNQQVSPPPYTGGLFPRSRPGGTAQQNPYRWRPGGTAPPYGGMPYPQQGMNQYHQNPYPNTIEQLARLLEELRERVREQEQRGDHNA